MIRQLRSNPRDDDLLTVAEAALIAHRSVRTLRRAYLAGRLVAHRDGNGRGVTIRYGDLLAWLTSGVVRAPAHVDSWNPIARVDVRTETDARVETGNLDLLSAARRRRATRARAAALPQSSSAVDSGSCERAPDPEPPGGLAEPGRAVTAGALRARARRRRCACR